MTKSEFKKKILSCIFDINTTYNNTYRYINGKKVFYNCGYNHGKYYSFDCWNWIKCLFWGWIPGYSEGSFLYAPGVNGVMDWNGAQMLEWCEDVSTDFKKVPECDLLLTAKEDHLGVYIGEQEWEGYIFNTAECTPATDYMIGGCLLSYTDEQGRRYNHKGGAQVGSWAKHGRPPILEEDPSEFIIVYEDDDVIIGKAKK